MISDMKNRRKNLRVDDWLLHQEINTCRQRIFEKGTRINAKVINTILGEKSYIPIRVSGDSLSM